jgi:hypothetical protein
MSLISSVIGTAERVPLPGLLIRAGGGAKLGFVIARLDPAIDPL